MTAAILTPMRRYLVAATIAATVAALPIVRSRAAAAANPSPAVRDQLVRSELLVLLAMQKLGLVDEARIEQWVSELVLGRVPYHPRGHRSHPRTTVHLGPECPRFQGHPMSMACK